METLLDYSQLDKLVRVVFRIDDITQGGAKDKYLFRYRGNLLNEESENAYDQLSGLLRPYGLTPLFRWDDNRHAILIVNGLPEPRKSNNTINLVLFIFTFLSVLLTGAMYGMDQKLPAEILPAALELIQRGWPFAVSMLAILGAHEFGHYFAGRKHGVHVSLPYFIPMPFSPFGTMGAFINIKEPPKNRRVLLDIGVAGPFCGLIVAVPVLWIGLSISNLDVLPTAFTKDMMMQMEGNSIMYLLMKFLVFGQLLPVPASFGNLSPAIYWLRYFFTGQPYPFGGIDVLLSPVAWAGWAGILVTGLNLIPAGQLDGGHILYVLLGKNRAKYLFPAILAILLILGIFWNGWWFWAVLIFLLGRSYAEPLDQITALDGRRRFFALLALLIFLVTFTPVPLLIN